MGITIQVSSLVCVACGAHLKPKLLRGDALEQLSRTRGSCPNCGKDRFRATVTRTMDGYEPPQTEDYLISAAFPALAPVLGTHGHNVAWDSVFELPELGADELFDRLSRSPEVVSEWITALRKEDAKSRLRPDQGLCGVCGEIYTLQLAGHTREGYCSPLCKKQGQGGSPASRVSADAPGKAIPCPKCGRPVRPRPRANCMYCGTKPPM